jgi:hypothetical protein
MDWTVTLGGDFPTRFWEVFTGTLENFLGARQSGPYSNELTGLAPFLVMVLGLLFARRVITMVRKISQGDVEVNQQKSDQGGFRNE